jgi:hypothetical protein
MAARSGLFTRRDQDRTIELSLLSFALDVVREESCLRPDAEPNDERLLDSVCQFDILASLAAVADADSVDTRFYYTSFARFYTSRSQPAVSRLLRDPEMRKAIFPKSDEFLALALIEINHQATRERFRYAGWDGFDDPSIGAFIDKHRTVG